MAKVKTFATELKIFHKLKLIIIGLHELKSAT
jgi:hypothetical protein